MAAAIAPAMAAAPAFAPANAFAPQTVGQKIKTSVEVGQSLTAMLSAITDNKILYEVYLGYIEEIDFIYGVRDFRTRDQLLRWAAEYVGPGPEPFSFMVEDFRQELEGYYKPTAETNFKNALNTVYSAVVARLTGPDSSEQDPILDKFVLAYHGYLPEVTKEAQWGDYLCAQAYDIVKDDPAL